MSTIFLNHLKQHVSRLTEKMQSGQTKSVIDQELAQARQFLSATKDPKWRAQLIKRISVLEKNQKGATDTRDLTTRHKVLSDALELIKDHPEYNRTRKKRKVKAE